MRRTAPYSPLTAALAAVLSIVASAQPAAPPQTYSFTAVSSLIGPNMTIKVDRNGAQELIERATIGKPGETGKFHDRVLYDLQAHRLYSLDLNSNICTTQEYSSPNVPDMIDPIGSAAQTTSGLAGMPAQLWSKDTVNGIAVKVAELPMPEGQGRSRFWLDEKYGFMVKMAMATGKDPLTDRFEIKKLSWAPPPAALFTVPQGCKQIGGVSNANGGHAEMSVEVKVPTQTVEFGHDDRRGSGTAAGAPSLPSAPGVPKVTAVRLRLVPESYTGACPSPIVLTADITANGPGVVWYRFLAGAVYKNGPTEGTVQFSAAGTKTVTLEGTIRTTPAVGQTSMIAAMEDEQGNHGPQTVSSGPVNYNRVCVK